MIVTFQSKMNDDNYLIEEVEKEYFPQYKFEDVIHELNHIHKHEEDTGKKMPFKQCSICHENKTLPEFFKYSQPTKTKICKLCFRKASYGID